MSQSYEVSTAAVTGYASSVAGLADELRSALATGQVTGRDMFVSVTSIISRVEEELCGGLSPRTRTCLLDQLQQLRERAEQMRTTGTTDPNA